MTTTSSAPSTRAKPWYRRKRWIALAAFVALLLFATLLRPPRPPTLLSAEVTRGKLQRTVVASGTVEAHELVSVGTRASGQVKSLKVKLGERVRAGQLIAEIDAVNQQNALRNAEAALASRRAQHEAQRATAAQAHAAFARQQATLQAGVTSRADFDVAQATMRSAQAQLASLDAQIAQTRTELDTARANLGYARIVAPIDGTVVALVATEGQTLNAVQSSPTLVKIARLDPMTVEAEISEADVIRVKPGQPAFFTILGDPERRFPGTLRSIEPAPESLSEETTGVGGGDSGLSTDEAVYYNALFDVPNADGTLRIGMTAQVQVVLQAIRDTLKVPSAALGERRRDGRYTVRVLDARGRPQARAVRIGLDNQVEAQVLDGLRVGERVVVGEAVEARPPSSFPPRPGNGPNGPGA